MNIFSKVALQAMKRSRTRTMVTVIGVILSAAMITAVATFAVSLQSYMVNGAAQKYGGWQVGFLDVDPDFVQERIHDDGVANTAIFENIGYATLEGGQNPDKPYLFIAGFGDNMKCPPVKSRGFTTCGRITAFNTGGTDERILHWPGCRAPAFTFLKGYRKEGHSPKDEVWT